MCAAFPNDLLLCYSSDAHTQKVASPGASWAWEQGSNTTHGKGNAAPATEARRMDSGF